MSDSPISTENTNKVRATPPPEPKVSIEDVLRAFTQEVKGIYQRMLTLEHRVARYDQIFERIFQEEAKARLNPSSTQGLFGGEAGMLSPLDRLQMEVERMKGRE